MANGKTHNPLPLPRSSADPKPTFSAVGRLKIISNPTSSADFAWAVVVVVVQPNGGGGGVLHTAYDRVWLLLLFKPQVIRPPPTCFLTTAGGVRTGARGSARLLRRDWPGKKIT
jgi:hypothetical protein